MSEAAWRLPGLDLSALDRLAQLLSLFIAPGDGIALSGPLGAGKTTFTRLVARHLGYADEVQSPSFGLIQSYPTPRLTLDHCDFYRLEPGDIPELGLEDALEDGALIVEWAERAEDALPPDRLGIVFAETPDSDRRDLTLRGSGSWNARLERMKALADFLDRTGYADASLDFMQGDASSRAYARAGRADGSVILMNAPPMPDGPPIRDGKPYSQLVHLAEDVRPFVAIDAALRARGLSAPAIYASDLEHGFLLLEDFGTGVFGAEIAAGADQALLTQASVDVLLHLAKTPPDALLPVEGGTPYVLPRFDAEAMLTEASLLLDWLWPAVHDAPAPEPVREAYLAGWRPLLAEIENADTGWVLRDFHSPNLMWLPERMGLARVGLLDFQDGMQGPLAYDLVSLLQDARLTVPASLEARLLDYYCASRDGFDSAFSGDQLRAQYAILGAQRASKILGIFARLALRDGKRAYLAHMPQVASYLARDLDHPALQPLRGWYDAELPPPEALPPASL